MTPLDQMKQMAAQENRAMARINRPTGISDNFERAERRREVAIEVFLKAHPASTLTTITENVPGVHSYVSATLERMVERKEIKTKPMERRGRWSLRYSLTSEQTPRV